MQSTEAEVITVHMCLLGLVSTKERNKSQDRHYVSYLAIYVITLCDVTSYVYRIILCTSVFLGDGGKGGGVRGTVVASWTAYQQL